MEHEEGNVGQQETTDRGTQSRDSERDLDQIAASIRRNERKKFEREVEKERLRVLEDFKAEHGLDDDVLDEIKNRDARKNMERHLKAEVTKREKRIAELEGRISKIEPTLYSIKTRDAVFRAAKDAINPEVVWSSIRDSLKVDPDTFEAYVVDGSGERTEATIEETVSSFLDKNKYLMKPIGSPGGGARGSDTSATTSSAGPDTSTPEGRLEVLRRELGGG